MVWMVCQNPQFDKNPQFDWPKKVRDDMLLSEVFGHCFDKTFRESGLTTVADLTQCRRLSWSDVININAWLRRCWWYM